MYASRIVECATVEDLFDHPQHPYTEGLFRSVPKLGAHSERLETIPGTVPNPARFPTGCKFHPRCPRTRELAAEARPERDGRASDRPTRRSACCGGATQDEPELREVLPKHGAACQRMRCCGIP